MEQHPAPDPDPARARRLARIAAAAPREVPGRQEQFGQRLATVRLATTRRARREALRGRAVAIGRVVLAVAVAVGLDQLTTTGVAAAAGLLLFAALVTASHLLSRAAHRRGAAAWDWQAGRHRVLGNPAARVQQADQPRARSSSPFTGGN